MSKLLELQEKLQETNAAIVQLEQALSNDPSSISLTRNLKSIQKRYDSLEADFLSEASKMEVSICKYRLFNDYRRPTIKAIAEALSSFQYFFSTVYKAIKNAPLQKAPSRKDIDEESEFGLAYTFSGSVGVALTLPDELILIGKSRLDEAIEIIFKMAKAEQSGQIVSFAKRLGLAPVRQMYQWINEHTQSGFGADIEWLKRGQIEDRLFIQEPEIKRLKQLMEKTGEETIEEIVVEGELLGADVPGHRFHMKGDIGEIRGSFSDAISEEHTVELPKHYRAKLRKTTEIKYSTEEAKEHYFLIEIEPIYQ